MIEIVKDSDRWLGSITTRDRRGRSVVESETFTSQADAFEWARTRDMTAADDEERDLTVARVVMQWHDSRLASIRDTTTVRRAIAA